MQKININQISAMNISYQFFSFEYFLDSMVTIGCKNIDIWTGYPHFLVDDDYETKARKIRDQCDSVGINVRNITPKVIGWPLNIADKSEKIRGNAIRYIKRCIDAAEILGAPSLQLVPGTGLYDEPVEDAWKLSRESLSILSEYALNRKKQLALEAIQILESNLVGNKSQLKKMVEEVNSPALGAVVDTTHMEKNGETLDEYFDILGEKIKRVHLNESNQLPWGEGNNPLNVYISQLNRHKYNGPITIEICSKVHYLNPHNAMKKTFDYVIDALARQI